MPASCCDQTLPRMNSTRPGLVRALLPRALVITVTFSHSSVAAERPDSVSPPETTVLSPFQVATSRDTGYLSTAAGSAGRVSQELKDIPQSITVLNQELIRDLAPDRLDDILAF